MTDNSPDTSHDPDPFSPPMVKMAKGRSKRLRQGHPWVFSNEIQMDTEAKALAPGTLVRLVDAGGEQLGQASFNPHSLIAGRVLSHRPDATVNTAFFANRLQRALALRNAIYETPYYRLIHAEADGLPGLIVDRFDDVLVCQLNSAGMETLRKSLIAALQQVFTPRAIVLRRDSGSRSLEGLSEEEAEIVGQADDTAVVEAGLRLPIDALGGQKTGWFFDQRDNRDFIARLSAGRRVLDCYCHTGGFALRAAQAGATAATGVDSAGAALELATAGAAANDLAQVCTFEKADVFDYLGEAKRGTFDLVIADPPAFAKLRKHVKPSLKAYRKLGRLAGRVVAANGFLAVGCCSHHVPPAEFIEAISHGVRDAGKTGRIIRFSGAGPDHPVHPALPESAYLKFLVFALD